MPAKVREVGFITSISGYKQMGASFEPIGDYEAMDQQDFTH